MGIVVFGLFGLRHLPRRLKRRCTSPFAVFGHRLGRRVSRRLPRRQARPLSRLQVFPGYLSAKFGGRRAMTELATARDVLALAMLARAARALQGDRSASSNHKIPPKSQFRARFLSHETNR